MRRLSLGLLCLGLACSGAASAPAGDTQAPQEPGPITHRFSFAIIADPHIAGSDDHEARLETAVTWINDHAESRDIQLVLVLGDIGWGDGLPLSGDLLGVLDVPWVPIIGDNVVIYGQDAEFQETFEDQYGYLSETLEGWTRTDRPVWEPNYEQDVYLHNLRFEHEGVRFIGLDWNIRGVGGLASEFAELHDFKLVHPRDIWGFFLGRFLFGRGVPGRFRTLALARAHFCFFCGFL